MIPLIDHLRALLGSNSLSTDEPLLAAADSRAAKLPREQGVLHCKAIQDAVNELAGSSPSRFDTRAAYYLGLQVGWRVAQSSVILGHRADAASGTIRAPFFHPRRPS